MSKYKIGDRVEYIVDGIVQDTGTVTRAFEGSSIMTAYEWYEEHAGWWAKWDSDSKENHFCENESGFRKVEPKTSDIENAGWFTNNSTRNIRPKFMFEFLMSDGTVRQGGINEVPGIDWNINKEDDGYPHVVKYRLVGTVD